MTSSLIDLEHIEKVAFDHRLRASRARGKAKAYRPADPEYTHLMQLVGYHTIQAGLWDKQARKLKGENL